MAILSASPNPVPFGWLTEAVGPGPTTEETTTITWSSEPSPLGRLAVSIDGAEESWADGGPEDGKPNGVVTYKVQLGRTYDFRVRRVDPPDQSLLASLKVTTVKKPVLLGAAVAIVDKAFQGRQGIYNLSVRPGIDACTISFRTRQPVVPWVFITGPGGTLVGMSNDSARSTAHRIEINGFFDVALMRAALAQDTVHRYRIVADALPNSDGPAKIEAKGRFRTGSRTATILFEKIKVTNDGDSGGEGELRFEFAGGDAATGKFLGNVERFDPGTVDDDGPDLFPLRSITIPFAPRGLWATVAGYEYDEGFGAFAPAIGFRPPGSRNGRGSLDWAFVTRHFVIDRAEDTPFDMETGDFRVAFHVFGRLRVETREGEWLTIRALGRPRPRLWSTIRVVGTGGPGDRAKLVASNGHGHLVAIDPDGAVHHQAVQAAAGSGLGPWSRLGGRFRGPVTAVALPGGYVVLFGLGEDGTVLHQTHGPRPAAADDGWRSLGGAFVGAVAAARNDAEGAGRIEIFARDACGTVFHRAFEAGAADGRGDWREVGSGVRGNLAALASPRGGLGLFAIAPGGEVLHKRRPPGEDGWLPDGPEWERLGAAGEGPLSAEAWPDGTGLLLAVVAEADETVRVLPWPDYPEGAPGGSWQLVGTVTSLLQGRFPSEDGEEDADGV